MGSLGKAVRRYDIALDLEIRTMLTRASEWTFVPLGCCTGAIHRTTSRRLRMREHLRGRVHVVRQMPKRGKSSGASLVLMLERYRAGINAFMHAQKCLPALVVS